MGAKFKVYEDTNNEFRWTLVAANGQAIATSGEGYKSMDGAKAGIESVKKNASAAEVQEES